MKLILIYILLLIKSMTKSQSDGKKVNKLIRQNDIGLWLDGQDILQIYNYYGGNGENKDYILRSIFIPKSEIPMFIKNLQSLL